MSVPLTDTGLLNWARTFKLGIATSPTSVGLTSAQSTAFDAFFDAYEAAWQAWSDDPSRSKSLTEAKYIAKGNLIANARELYNIVQAFPGSTDQEKVDLGVTVRKPPSPRPIPTVAPELRVAKVFGRQFTLDIRNAVTHKRARPFGAAGATLYSFVGATPPDDTAGWVSEGNVTKWTTIVNLPADVAVGSRVYFTANWYGTRGDVGPGCTPVMTQVGVEGVLSA